MQILIKKIRKGISKFEKNIFILNTRMSEYTKVKNHIIKWHKSHVNMLYFRRYCDLLYSAKYFCWGF